MANIFGTFWAAFAKIGRKILVALPATFVRARGQKALALLSQLAAHLDGLPHLLLDDVDVVVVEAQVSDAIFDEPAAASQSLTRRPAGWGWVITPLALFLGALGALPAAAAACCPAGSGAGDFEADETPTCSAHQHGVAGGEGGGGGGDDGRSLPDG